MAVLKKIKIKGYRSIKDVSLELRPLNVLIGANGAGKGNFVSFFKMLNEMMAGRLQEYIGKTGRGQSILHFGPKITPQLDLKQAKIAGPESPLGVPAGDRPSPFCSAESRIT